MINLIKGILIEKQAPDVLVDVQGVGYGIQAPMSTFYHLPEVGQPVMLHTHFIVREDAQLLFGFHQKSERQLFRSLIRVNGVGPKLALTILSGMESDEFVRCVHDGDSACLVKLPGVGKKTADRLIVEMRDRLDEWQSSSDSQAPMQLTQPNSRAAIQEAENALIALGYKPQDAAKAIASVARDTPEEERSSERLIRKALKSMVSA